MKNLADCAGHIIDAASPLFGWEQPERRVALWIQVDDQDLFVMIGSQTGTDMNGIRGLTDASFEIDKRDYLAHPAFVGLRRDPQPNRSSTLGRAENLKRG
jgi:hypothetical protein